jgi:hypothetical protein
LFDFFADYFDFDLLFLVEDLLGLLDSFDADLFLDDFLLDLRDLMWF